MWVFFAVTSSAADPAPAARVELIGPALEARMTGPGGSHHAGCPVPLTALRHVAILHWGFDGAVHQGELVLHADAVGAVVTALQTAFIERFPIERISLVEEFAGSDESSMAANNTSAYNCRAVAGGASWSQHAYGRAIDVNPLVNPFVSAAGVRPPEGHRYLVRSAEVPGLLIAASPLVRAFATAGWTWGGTWKSSKDYQHFSASGR